MYERPEIVEIGQAAELTLGWWQPSPRSDGCDCTARPIEDSTEA